MPGGKLPIAAGSYVDETSQILLIAEDESQVAEAVRQLVRIGLDHVVAWILADDALSNVSLTDSYPRIATADLPAGATVLDVRDADEFAASHVKGAKNIAYTRLAARLDEIPSGKTLFVHCGSGIRAALASAYLASRGHDVVHVDGPFTEIPTELME